MKIGNELLSVFVLCVALLLTGCAAQDNPVEAVAASGSVAGGKANAFNPYLQKQLPNTRGLSSEGQAFGGATVAIEAEAAHRPHWREELYPVVFGRPTAPHEILVVLDFARPQSRALWQAVEQAAKSISPEQCKIVVFAKNSENYGTDLMGLVIWNTWARKGQGMSCLGQLLNAWQEAKAAQRSAGKSKPFNNEYDSAVGNGYPIHYDWIMKQRPAIAENDELHLVRYCYDAGNVNMYQAVQVMRYYGISSLPAVLVDGKAVGKVTPATIAAAIAQ